MAQAKTKTSKKSTSVTNNVVTKSEKKGGESMTTKSTAKTKSVYIPKGIAYTYNQHMYMILNDGTQLVVGKIVSVKQAKYYKCLTAKNQKDAKVVDNIYNKAVFKVDEIDKHLSSDDLDQ